MHSPGRGALAKLVTVTIKNPVRVQYVLSMSLIRPLQF